MSVLLPEDTKVSLISNDITKKKENEVRNTTPSTNSRQLKIFTSFLQDTEAYTISSNIFTDESQRDPKLEENEDRPVIKESPCFNATFTVY